MSRRLSASLGALAFGSVFACGGQPARPPAEIAPLELPADTEAQASIAPAPGVVLAAPACLEGADERCDAVDDDCDGAVDEGCGGPVGEGVSVALAWNTDAVVTASITGPGSGSTPAPGSCTEGAPRLHAEARAEATAGEYQVGVALADACGVEGTTTAFVTVSALGRVLASYRVEVGDALTPVATVTLAPPVPSSP